MDSLTILLLYREPHSFGVVVVVDVVAVAHGNVGNVVEAPELEAVDVSHSAELWPGSPSSFAIGRQGDV